MKLYCFVILVFISVIFAVGEEREWRNGGIRGANALNTNQNKANLNQPLARSLGDITNKQLSNNQEEPEQASKPSLPKYPLQTQTQHPKPIDENDKGKHEEKNNSDAQHQNVDNDKETAKKLEEEAQTINKVIVVLASLGASLLLVAIAIAVLYLKVRKQQQYAKADKIHVSASKGLSGENTGGNTIDNDDTSNSNNSNGKRIDGGSGVGNGETSDDSSIFITPEKPNIINSSDSSGGVNNGVDIGVIGDKDEIPCIPYKQFHNIPQLSPPVQPSAPSVEKLIEEGNDNMDNNISNSSISFPHLTAPPAYTPTAPPIYALPHSPIPELPEFNDSMIMYMNRNYQQNPHYLETNNNDGNDGETFVRMSPSVALPPSNTGVWTPQTNIPTDNTPIERSNDSTIIHPFSTMSPTSNLHENNNDNRSTHQRHNSSTI